MTGEELLATFGYAVSAPAGVQRLRTLVLDLAVRGRLVPQNPNSEPASALLGSIDREREQLLAAKAAKQPKGIPPLTEDDQPFPIPDAWEWVRVGDVAEHRLGKTLNSAKQEGELRPYLRSTNVQAGHLVLSDIKEMRFTEAEMDDLLLKPGDLLVCEGGDAGRSAMWGGEIDEVYFQNALHRLRGYRGIEPAYLAAAFAVAKESGRLDRRLTGIAIKHLSSSNVRSVEIPLPPTEEQQRIVESVEALMSVCRRLEEEQARARSLRMDTARSTLTTVVSTKRFEPDRALELIDEHLALTLSPGEGAGEVVSELRAAILDLAVRGRLVAQNPTEESPEPTLDAVAELRSGRALSLRTVEPDEQPYEIPPGWVWTRLGFPLDFVNGRAFKSTEWGETGLRIIRIQNITDPSAPADRFDGEVDPKHVIETGDLLLSWSGTLRASIWPAERAVLNQHIFNVRPIADALSVSYALIGLSALINEMTSKTQGSAMQHITKAKLVKIPIPIPPIAEQERIVRRVDELMAMCDSLEAAFASERETAADFAESAIAEVVGRAA